MPSKKDNPGKHVTQKFCDERFGRIIDKLTTIDNKLTEWKEEQKERGRDWKSLVISIASGIIIALITLLLSKFI